jgi:hypothetical protein
LHPNADAEAPDGPVPHWFTSAINPLAAQVAALAEQIPAINARMDNHRFHRWNRKAMYAAAGYVDGYPTVLSQVLKTIDGYGPGLPGLPPIPVPAIVPPVGASPGPLFPATIEAMRAMTAPQLHQLSAFYNHTFGVVAGDKLDVQIDKFKAFICGN